MAATERAGSRRLAPEPGAGDDPPLADVVAAAARQFAQLTGSGSPSVTGVRREGEGWSVLVDVVELERIPASTSVVATYRVDLDAGAVLCGYERIRRYTRGATDPA